MDDVEMFFIHGLTAEMKTTACLTSIVLVAVCSVFDAIDTIYC